MTTEDIQSPFGDQRLPSKFWAKARLNPVTGCWEWTAYLNKKGYGSFGPFRGVKLAHRVSYEALVGPIPEPLVIDHLCRVRNCVNPAHMEPVTSRENSRRGDSWARERGKTHCPAGHAYDDVNTYKQRGERVCKLCLKARHSAYYFRVIKPSRIAARPTHG